MRKRTLRWKRKRRVLAITKLADRTPLTMPGISIKGSGATIGRESPLLNVKTNDEAVRDI